MKCLDIKRFCACAMCIAAHMGRNIVGCDAQLPGCAAVLPVEFKMARMQPRFSGVAPSLLHALSCRVPCDCQVVIVCKVLVHFCAVGLGAVLLRTGALRLELEVYMFARMSCTLSSCVVGVAGI